jgi:outer membrane protein OmpA-like peptidoglycan-associated protein
MSYFAYGQDNYNADSNYDYLIQNYIKNHNEYNHTIVKDKIVSNTLRNRRRRKSFYKYPEKPKDAWELGIHSGYFFLNGDVDPLYPLAGYGFGIHLRKAVHYVFSVRFDLFYGLTYGLDPQPWNEALTPEHNFGGIFNEYVDSKSNWYPSYKLEYVEASIQGVLNLGNVLFHKEKNKWNLISFIGLSLNSNQTMLDIYDAKGNIYDVKAVDAISGAGSSRKNRLDRINKLKLIYDGKYETKAYNKKYVYEFQDKYLIHAAIIGGIGIYRKLNKRVNIGLEHQIMINDNDYLDGMKYRTAADQSNSSDILQYTNIRLAVNLTNFKKRTEPLYWLNPMENVFNDIAKLKQRPVLDLTDSDADGVIDMMDMEPNSPVGCPVDTRGITLDSDSDGLADCKDKEPYSPPGYQVDEYGKAIVPDNKKSYVTKDEVRKIFEENMSRAGIRMVAGSPGMNGDSTAKYTYFSNGMGDWFLPMIHFDKDKYNIKNEYYGQLKHVAFVMEKYPNLCVTAYGATDIRNSMEYNNMLSYNRAKAAIDFLVKNYGIDRNRFKLMYGGETLPLVPGLPDSYNVSKEVSTGHYMNRRVEFRVCLDEDYNMPKPSGVLKRSKRSEKSKKSKKSVVNQKKKMTNQIPR